MRYTIVLTPAPEGGFSVDVPALPHAFTEGATIEECIENAREVIQLVTETMRARGEEIPAETTAEHILTIDVEV